MQPRVHPSHALLVLAAATFGSELMAVAAPTADSGAPCSPLPGTHAEWAHMFDAPGSDASIVSRKLVDAIPTTNSLFFPAATKEFLAAQPGPVELVACTGLGRAGKTAILIALAVLASAQREHGAAFGSATFDGVGDVHFFRTCNTHDPCTLGIDAVAIRMRTRSGRALTLVLLDVEGTKNGLALNHGRLMALVTRAAGLVLYVLESQLNHDGIEGLSLLIVQTIDQILGTPDSSAGAGLSANGASVAWPRFGVIVNKATLTGSYTLRSKLEDDGNVNLNRARAIIRSAVGPDAWLEILPLVTSNATAAKWSALVAGHIWPHVEALFDSSAPIPLYRQSGANFVTYFDALLAQANAHVAIDIVGPAQAVFEMNARHALTDAVASYRESLTKGQRYSGAVQEPGSATVAGTPVLGGDRAGANLPTGVSDADLTAAHQVALALARAVLDANLKVLEDVDPQNTAVTDVRTAWARYSTAALEWALSYNHEPIRDDIEHAHDDCCPWDVWVGSKKNKLTFWEKKTTYWHRFVKRTPKSRSVQTLRNGSVLRGPWNPGTTFDVFSHAWHD